MNVTTPAPSAALGNPDAGMVNADAAPGPIGGIGWGRVCRLATRYNMTARRPMSYTDALAAFTFIAEGDPALFGAWERRVAARMDAKVEQVYGPAPVLAAVREEATGHSRRAA